MSSDQKRDIFQDFKDNKIHLLIATSIIEVGIDIHNTSIMAIMNPERFGLSSLHQLRGRVGRGQRPGFCFLINERPINEQSYKRLKIIETNSNGFEIAEEDLKIRGEGNLFGHDQSGVIQSKKLANIITHQKILLSAVSDTELMAKRNDPFFKEQIKNFQKSTILTQTT